MSDEFEKHPSWGMAVFSRITFAGKHRLFGSSLENHGSSIVLTIREAQRKHDLSQDWLHSSSRLPVCEVEFSAAQFAALLTTMNIGDGVPCTIRYVDGKARPEPPDDQREVERVQASFKDNLKEITSKLAELMKGADEMLGRKEGLKVGDRKELRHRLDMIRQDIESNLPFVLKQFERATEKVTTSAKAEIDAFVTEAATRLGMERLKTLVGTNDTLPELVAADNALVPPRSCGTCARVGHDCEEGEGCTTGSYEGWAKRDG